eukprot:4382591-Prymnesium_polylepis.2
MAYAGKEENLKRMVEACGFAADGVLMLGSAGIGAGASEAKAASGRNDKMDERAARKRAMRQSARPTKRPWPKRRRCRCLRTAPGTAAPKAGAAVLVHRAGVRAIV